jgi:signal peptidase I
VSASTDAASATSPPAEGSTLLAWATGGAVVCACLDLLCAVLMGLEEVPLRRELASPFAAFAYAGFGMAALAWCGRAGLSVAVIWHLAVASMGWFVLPGRLGTAVPPLLQVAIVVHALAAAMAVAGVLTLARDATRRRRATGAASGAVAENLDAVLVAIVFALVIRHFAVEAYKIPTESMSPNLLGEDPRRGPGDRVLVEKWSTFFGGPSRFEIWVFRPPLERNINYVKRVAGLPGETVTIDDGDLYVNGAIARKPPHILEDMWCAVHPPALPRTRDVGSEAPLWSGEGFTREGETGFKVGGATAPRMLRFGPVVKDGEFEGGSNPVGDVRLRFEVQSVEPGTRLAVRLVGRGGPVDAVLDVSGPGGTVSTAAGKSELTASWSSIESVEVRFVDLEFVVLVNGSEVHRSEVPALPSESRPDYSVSFGVEKGGTVFRNPRIDRDVFYVNTGLSRFQVPEGHYLFLGDNSRKSKDARSWNGHVVRESATGGATFVSENRPAAGKEAGTVGFKDRDGVYREMPRDQVTIEKGAQPFSFVPQRDLHGRAFAVFWPPSWRSTVADRVRLLP